MEIADIFVVNKADRPGADRLRQEIEVTLGIRKGNAFKNVPAHHGAIKSGPAVVEPETEEWRQAVLGTVAVESEGTAEVISALEEHWSWLEGTGALRQRRRRRLHDRTRDVVNRAIRAWVWSETEADRLIEQRLDEVEDGSVSPYEVANDILDGLKQGTRL